MVETSQTKQWLDQCAYASTCAIHQVKGTTGLTGHGSRRVILKHDCGEAIRFLHCRAETIVSRYLCTTRKLRGLDVSSHMHREDGDEAVKATVMMDTSDRV